MPPKLRIFTLIINKKGHLRVAFFLLFFVSFDTIRTLLGQAGDRSVFKILANNHYLTDGEESPDFAK